jgi:hypothetical protein
MLDWSSPYLSQRSLVLSWFAEFKLPAPLEKNESPREARVPGRTSSGMNTYTYLLIRKITVRGAPIIMTSCDVHLLPIQIEVRYKEPSRLCLILDQCQHTTTIHDNLIVLYFLDRLSVASKTNSSYHSHSG